MLFDIIAISLGKFQFEVEIINVFEHLDLGVVRGIGTKWGVKFFLFGLKQEFVNYQFNYKRLKLLIKRSIHKHIQTSRSKIFLKLTVNIKKIN